MMNINHLRNIAIIAHVDHGKTTLVDRLLQSTHTLSASEMQERVMDSNELERERGITILAKNTSMKWGDYRINLIDTPGHADFGGEVERILSMVDAVLLIVDAVEGPMPQTRFVTQKSFAKGLHPLVVINKIDRNGARPEWVLNEVFDLFDKLGATESQLDFPVIYTSATLGYATLDPNIRTDNMELLFKSIVDHVPPPSVEINGPLQMQISSLTYSPYIGPIGIGRVHRGTIRLKQPIAVVKPQGEVKQGKAMELFGFHGLKRISIETAFAGDIIALAGVQDLRIADTICDPNHIEPLPALSIDKPTIRIILQVNQSPFAGKEGQFLTSRKLQERLDQEMIHNVALKVEQTDDPDKFLVSGRGELHLSILIETMRREGYEFSLSRPEVILKQVDNDTLEPYEQLVLDVTEDTQGTIMSALSQRHAQLENMTHAGDYIRMEYTIPTRHLFGFQSEFLSLTAGKGLMYHSFASYKPMLQDKSFKRRQGVLISNAAGKATSYALWNLQPRGRMFILPQTEVYEGMIIGLHNRDNDLVVNVTKEKQLTNIRAAGSDENIILTPPIQFSIEQALGFIADDELVEVTPKCLRLRKKLLKEHERKRQQKK